MKEELSKISELIGSFDDISKSDIRGLMLRFFTKISSRLENYVGDYPTFIEPVYLEDNVKIGDDVLLGPNVYIGVNSVIEDYVEISNTIIFNNVNIGQNFKLENCIVAKNSSLNFKNLNMKNSVLVGTAKSKSELQFVEF
ncbi:MAG: hypothetical protein HWN80_13690 [Candidatus Lokiarchaeota archaeon]|nr:hypothetical protein [Candidatus Lokiarchaeota archaeon]